MRSYWEGKEGFYDEYADAQTKLNVQKFGTTWVTGSEIAEMAEFINEQVLEVNSGICHGSRNGYEVREFQKRMPSTQVIGTDISHTANDVKDMIQWDFHEMKPEWAKSFNFVYTNSFDHAYDLEKAMTAWMDSLDEHGVLLLHTNGGTKLDKPSVTAGDCLSLSEAELRFLIESKWVFRGRHSLRSGKCFFAVGWI